MDVRHSKLFAHLQKFREQADYGPMLALSREDGASDLATVEDFSAKVKRMLKITGPAGRGRSPANCWRGRRDRWPDHLSRTLQFNHQVIMNRVSPRRMNIPLLACGEEGGCTQPPAGYPPSESGGPGTHQGWVGSSLRDTASGIFPSPRRGISETLPSAGQGI